MSRLAERAGLAAGVAAIVVYCVFVSRGRAFWSDELFGWMVVTDASWGRMLAAWRAGADGGGVGFYVGARVWLGVFGHSALAFRMFSAAGCCVGFIAMAKALRRFYRAEVVALTMAVVWFGSRTILWQMVQTRFYGMLLGAAAVALYASMRSAQETDARGRESNATKAMTLVAHTALATAHPLGVVYSAAILVAAALSDALGRRKRWSFYAWSVPGWLILLFSGTAMRNSAAVGKPWFWTTRPAGMDLLGMYEPAAMPLAWLFGALLLVVVLAASAPRRWAWFAGLKTRRDAVVTGAVLALIPVAMWLVSQRGTSLFVDRYLIVFTLGIAVLVAEWWTAIFPWGVRAMPWPAKLLGAGLAAYVLFCVGQDALVDYPAALEFPAKDTTARLAAQLPSGEPVVMERVDVFDVMRFYRQTADRPMVHLLDWESVTAAESPRGDVSGYHEMEHWKAEGYFAESIQPSEEFLRTVARFTVLDDGKSVWFRKRILEQPQWSVTKVGEFSAGVWSETIWQVRRR